MDKLKNWLRETFEISPTWFFGDVAFILVLFTGLFVKPGFAYGLTVGFVLLHALIGVFALPMLKEKVSHRQFKWVYFTNVIEMAVFMSLAITLYLEGTLGLAFSLLFFMGIYSYITYKYFKISHLDSK